MKDLMENLIRYSQKDYYPFHMPGHKRNPLSIDITEIEGFDNLHHPEGIIRDAQERAAELYGSRECYYCVNGSTGALLSAVSAAVPYGGKILIARNCHKAVYHGIYLRGLRVSYVYPQREYEFGINGGILPEDVENLLAAKEDISAVLITSPTYDGVVSDVESIAGICHRQGVPLIVDEAHGAHFGFHGYFPESALAYGADIVIHSLHKTLPSMTQTALLHNNSGRVSGELIRRFLGIYQSSSPSYVLMGSMDACVSRILSKGREEFGRYAALLEDCREHLGKLENIQLVPAQLKGACGIYVMDPSKLILSVRKCGGSGQALYDALLEKYHLQMEMSAFDYVLAMTSVGDTCEGFERLMKAVEALDKEMAEKKGHRGGVLTPGSFDNAEAYPRLDGVMTITQAMDSRGRRCPLKESEGKVSQEFAYLYPPGIPLIAPGERISREILSQLEQNVMAGLSLEGLSDYSNSTICVADE